MKQFIIIINLLAAVAFLVMSIATTYNIFTTLIETEEVIRNELWILLVVCFTGGVIMLSIAWGVAELTESRRARREMMLKGIRDSDDDDELVYAEAD